MITIEQVNEKIKDLGWSIFSDYTGFHKKCKLKCENGHIYQNIPSNVLYKKRKCKYCNQTIFDTDTVNQKLKDAGLLLLEKYDRKIKKQKTKCLHCFSVLEVSVPSCMRRKNVIRCLKCKPKTKRTYKSSSVNKLIEKLNKNNFSNIEILDHDIKATCQNKHSNLFNLKNTRKRIFCLECLNNICLKESIEIEERIKNTIKAKCKCGYRWKTTAIKIISGDCCVYCNHGIKKRRWLLSDEQFKFFLKKRGFIVNESEIIEKTDKDVKMKCLSGHDLFIPPIRVFRNSKYECPKCTGKTKLTEDIVNTRLKGRNIFLVNLRDKENPKKTEFKCGICNKNWITKSDSVLNGNCGCPRCCKRGFNTSKTGFFYIHKIIHKSGKIGLKIGISNNFNDRKRKILKASEIKLEIIFLIETNGETILNLEDYIKKKYKADFCFFTIDELKDGYTESIACSFYDLIAKEVYDFMKDKKFSHIINT
jgi:hypothetical protein